MSQSSRDLEILQSAVMALKGTVVANILGIDASYLSHILTGKRLLTHELKIRILMRWKALQLSPQQLSELHSLWPEVSRAVRNEGMVYVEVPPVFFAFLPLIAERSNFFEIDNRIKNTPISVRWQSSGNGESLLSGEDIIERVYRGDAGFGFISGELLRTSSYRGELMVLSECWHSTEMRICIPRGVYGEVAQGRRPIFSDIVKHVEDRGGKLYLGTKTAAPQFVEWLADNDNAFGLDALERLPRKEFTHEAAMGEWPSEECIIIAWPPHTFKHTRNHESPEDNPYMEISEAYYDCLKMGGGETSGGHGPGGDGKPHLDRNVPREMDIYRISREFNDAAYVLFTRQDYARENPDVCFAVHHGMDLAVRTLDNLQDSGKLEHLSVLLWDDLSKMMDIKPSEDEISGKEKEALDRYFRSELENMHPVLKMAPTALDLFLKSRV